METKTYLILGGAAVGGWLLWDKVLAPNLGVDVIPDTPLPTTSVAPPSSSTVPQPALPPAVTAVYIPPPVMPPVQTTVNVTPTPAPVNQTPVAPNPSLVNGRWTQAMWGKYFNVFDPASLSVSQIMNANGISANDANDFLSDLIANTPSANNIMPAGMQGHIIYNKLLAANPGDTVRTLISRGISGLGDTPPTTGFDIGWFTQSTLIPSVPNWTLVLGGLVAVKGIIA